MTDERLAEVERLLLAEPENGLRAVRSTPPRKRGKIPGLAKPTEIDECETCAEKLRRAQKASKLDVAELLSARAILNANPPYGPKVTVRFRGRKVKLCPRCDSVSSDDSGPRPLIFDAPSRAYRSGVVTRGTRKKTKRKRKRRKR